MYATDPLYDWRPARDRGATPSIDTSRLLRLPWTRDDNPNGWIEPTTRCQLKCPGCYRACDAPGFEGEHFRLAKAKADVDELIRRRRINALSIAGGEPLLYPQLDELIAHARSRGLEVQLVSNGIGLVDERLKELKELGVARIMIHVDRHQGRPGITTEEQANLLRREHCETFRRVGGVALGFIQPLSTGDVDDLEVLVPFFKENADVVSLVTFNRLQPLDDAAPPQGRSGEADPIITKLQETYGLEWAAYLPKTHSDDVSWLYSQVVLSGSTVIGSLDAKVFGAIQDAHRRKTGQYLFASRKRHLSLGTVGRALTSPAAWRTLRNWRRVRRPGDRLRLQLVLVINTPTRLPDGNYDRCEGCPDAMLHEGRLVPSCLLEILKGEQRVIEAS